MKRNRKPAAAVASPTASTLRGILDKGVPHALFASILGVSPQTLWRWSRTTGKPELNELQRNVLDRVARYATTGRRVEILRTFLNSGPTSAIAFLAIATSPDPKIAASMYAEHAVKE